MVSFLGHTILLSADAFSGLAGALIAVGFGGVLIGVGMLLLGRQQRWQ